MWGRQLRERHWIYLATISDEARQSEFLDQVADLSGDGQEIPDLATITKIVDLTIGDDNFISAIARYGSMLPLIIMPETEEEIWERSKDIWGGSIEKDIIYHSKSVSISAQPIVYESIETIGYEHNPRYSITDWASMTGNMFMRKLYENYDFSNKGLAELITYGIHEADIRHRLYVSLNHWCLEDYTSATSVILPLVEVMARSIYKTTIKPDKLDISNKLLHISLDKLLEKIEGTNLDKEQKKYLKAALVNKNYLAIRNQLTHGNIAPEKNHYIILFHAMCVLRFAASFAISKYFTKS